MIPASSCSTHPQVKHPQLSRSKDKPFPRRHEEILDHVIHKHNKTVLLYATKLEVVCYNSN